MFWQQPGKMYHLALQGCYYTDKQDDDSNVEGFTSVKQGSGQVPEDAVKKDRAFISASRQETQPLKNAVVFVNSALQLMQPACHQIKLTIVQNAINIFYLVNLTT